MWLGVALVLLLTMGSSLAAQSTSTGALTGTVTDATGGVVPNVSVMVTSADTGQVRAATTSANGSYSVGLLPPGVYRVRFQAAGFKESEVPSATIVVTETATLNQALQVGAQSEKVTVQGDVETVQTSNATVGTVMTSQTLTALPLTTRNYTNLLGLTAGANVGVFNAATIGRGTQDISVNGSSPNQNNFQMDGASVVSITGSGSALDNGGTSGIGIVNPDAIQEFKIQTSLYDAGYGRNPGANVNVVTKSGTNAFHGTAFEFLRNTAFNANDFFRKISLPVNGKPNNGKEVLNANQYGGTFGGPARRDKLFFFVSYQESQQKNGISSGGASAPILPPIPAGDRSNAAGLKQQLGSVFCPTGSAGGKTFAGFGTQVACDGSNINPVAINFLQLKNPDGTYYIPGSGTGQYTQTTFSIPARFEEHQAIGNIDYVINSKNTLSGRWFYTDGPTTYSFWCGTTVVGGTVPGTCLPSTGSLANYSVTDTSEKLTSILTNNLVNEARFSIQRPAANPTNTIPFTNNQVGIASLNPNPIYNQLDEIVLTGNAQFTTGSYFGNGQNKYTTQWEAADQVSWSHGKQTIRAGFEYERDRTDWNFYSIALGQESFNNFQDFLLGLPGCATGGASSAASPATGACAASQAAGITNGTTQSNIVNTGTTGSVTGPNGLIHAFRWGSANTFVQDDIKITPRLTLNLGLRWEYDGAVHDKYGDMTNIWPSMIKTVNVPVALGGTLGNSAATGTLAGFVVPSNYNPSANAIPPVGGVFQSNHKVFYQNNPPIDDFAPRIGFAWQPLASNRLVVRGGFGYFYDRLGLNTISAAATQGEPYAITVVQSGAANYFSTEAFPYGNPSPALAWTPRWVNLTPPAGTANSSNLSQVAVEQQIVTPLINQWNLNTQYEFARNWVLELGYVGTHGIHQYSGNRQVNEAQLVSAAAPVINGQTTNTTGNASLRVPYLGFAPGGLSTSETKGDVKFNSLQATVRKQMSHGLSLQAAYTWSKTLNDFTNASNNSANSGDPNNFKQQYGPSPSYRPQRLAINYSWDLPFGRAEGIVGKLTNGWNLSGVTTAQDGTALTITDTRGGTIYGFGPGSPVVSRAQFCPGMGPANVATAGGIESRLGGSILGGPGYFNAAAFCGIPTVGAINGVGGGLGFGNSGVGVILGPGQFNWDMSLIKNTQVGGIRENATLQFRAEFFNVFNHPQFNNPATLDVSKTTTFGQITTTSVNPRVIQFALKYIF
jgi:Carboxypeptidase regulatory-like domain